MIEVVHVEGVRKTFRQWLGRRPPKLVLDGIDLSVNRGEIFGLLGPNGAGKTTLMRILTGLVHADSGSVMVNGLDVRSQGRAVRRSVGFVYGEERSFFLRISLYENLRFYSRLYRPAAPDRRIHELIEAVGLSEATHARMQEFSSGMRQRAAIARGLLNDPDLVLMDEPSRALDPVGAGDLHRLIVERVADGRRTVMLATNLMHEAESLCHRLSLIDRGRAVMTGPLEEFRAQLGPSATYRLRVFGGPARLEAPLLVLSGVHTVTVADAGEARDVELEIDRHGPGLASAIRLLVESGCEIQSCREEVPSLEKVFQTVVRGPAPQLALTPAL
ncbi:MAG: ABC transporter ATP-binding protein [Actinobacteria bacterium]|nr:ABC transporter ATP-binding protein [Actinomycetota bacterium]